MIDGVISNPVALARLAGSGLVGVALAVRALHNHRDEGALQELAGFAALAIVAIALAPLHILNQMTGEPMVWLFGREGDDTGVVEFGTFGLFLLSASLCALLSFRTGGWERPLFGAGALATFMIAGEEVSWGQWIFFWRTPAAMATANLQEETNAHNFLTPGFYDMAYAFGGLTIIGAVAFLLLSRPGRALDYPPIGVLTRSRIAPTLFLAAAVLMLHPLFQELSELMLAIAVAYALVWRLELRPPPRKRA